MKLTYKGEEERIFPALGIVKPGDVVEVPEGFSHPDFVAGGGAKPETKTTTTKPSAPSDTKAGE